MVSVPSPALATPPAPVMRLVKVTSLPLVSRTLLLAAEEVRVIGRSTLSVGAVARKVAEPSGKLAGPFPGPRIGVVSAPPVWFYAPRPSAPASGAPSTLLL